MGKPGLYVVALRYARDCIMCSVLRWWWMVVSSGSFSYHASYSQRSLTVYTHELEGILHSSALLKSLFTDHAPPTHNAANAQNT